jgi:hypothetical protein
MKSGKVVDFRIVRLQNELDRYKREGIIPGMLLDGFFSVDDIFEKFYKKLPDNYQIIADELKEDYYHSLVENQVQLRAALRSDYEYTMSTLATEHESFQIPAILRKYRKSMNPVRAIYYDTRELFRGYDPENHTHHLLIGLITDSEYSNILLNALERDTGSLEKIIKRYYIPLTRMSSDIPLELFHARQTIKDFKHYHRTFREAKNWIPDE